MAGKLSNLLPFSGIAEVPDSDCRLMSFLAGDQITTIRRERDGAETLFGLIDDVRLFVTLGSWQANDHSPGQIGDSA